MQFSPFACCFLYLKYSNLLSTLLSDTFNPFFSKTRMTTWQNDIQWQINESSSSWSSVLARHSPLRVKALFYMKLISFLMVCQASNYYITYNINIINIYIFTYNVFQHVVHYRNTKKRFCYSVHPDKKLINKHEIEVLHSAFVFCRQNVAPIFKLPQCSHKVNSLVA